MAYPENTINDTGLKKVWDMIIAKLNLKVDKEAGKGLSTNDFTTTEKNKLGGIEDGAQVNTVTSVAGKTGAVELTKSDVGLNNVGNFKAVSTSASQGLTNTEKSNARTNIDTPSNSDIQSSITVPKASVVTVTDAAPINAEDITVDITPQQDLHGYDHPWAGGAGKNKLPMTVAGIKALNTTGTWNGNVYTWRDVTFTLLTDSDGNIIGIKVNGTPSESVYLLLESNSNEYFNTVGSKAVVMSGCPSGGSTSTYCINRYVSTASPVNIADVGSGVAFTYPSTQGQHNVSINITNGYTANNLIFYPMIRLASETDAAFAPYSNICPIEGWTSEKVDIEGANLWDNSDTEYGYLDTQGAVQAHQGFESLNYQEIKAGKLYILSFNRSALVSDQGMRIAWYDADKQFIRRDGILEGQGAGFKTTTATAPSNAKYARASVCITNATDIKFYQGEQYTVNFGQTVYGGKNHMTAGGTDKTHANIASYNGETINEPWLSSLDAYTPGATPTTGAQVVYPLTTPTTINTNAVDIPMLEGINTISGSTGDVSLKYQPNNVVGELKGEIQVANSFVAKMALREGSGAKDFSYGGWSFRLYIYRSMGQITMSVEDISATSVTEQAVVKVFNGESDYRAPEYLRPIFSLIQAATYTTPSGWAIQVYLKDDGYIMFTGMAPEIGASAPTRTNWTLVEPWLTHQQAQDLFD